MKDIPISTPAQNFNIIERYHKATIPAVIALVEEVEPGFYRISVECKVGREAALKESGHITDLNEMAVLTQLLLDTYHKAGGS